MAFLILAYAVYKRDQVLGKLYLMGIAFGFSELPTDAWNVQVIRTLVYNPDGPFIWDSPLYMPFSWTILIALIGSVSLGVARKYGIGPAIAVTTLVGGILVPFTEFLAHLAGTWIYRDCPMLFGSVPYYVILAEALIFMPLAPMVVAGIKRGWLAMAILGIVEGIWAFIATWIAYQLLG